LKQEKYVEVAYLAGRDTQKTQHGIETDIPEWWNDCQRGVETLRKPSTGLKLIDVVKRRGVGVVETLRKPSTGLKQRHVVRLRRLHEVETLRKPSTGLKPLQPVEGDIEAWLVETLRKPSTGLKPGRAAVRDPPASVETLRKPSTGLKQHW